MTQSTVVRRLPKPAWNRPWSPNAGGTSHRDQHKHTVRAAWPSSNKAATVCRTNKSFSLIVIENNWKPFGGVQKMNMLILSNSCWMCAADKLSERKERLHCRRGKKAQPRFQLRSFLSPFNWSQPQLMERFIHPTPAEGCSSWSCASSYSLRPGSNLWFASLLRRFTFSDKRSTILLWVAALTRRRAVGSSGTGTNSFLIPRMWKCCVAQKRSKGAKCAIHQNVGYREARDEYGLPGKIRMAATWATFTAVAWRWVD